MTSLTPTRVAWACAAASLGPHAGTLLRGAPGRRALLALLLSAALSRWGARRGSGSGAGGAARKGWWWAWALASVVAWGRGVGVGVAAGPVMGAFLAGEDADVPACLALGLGLLMGHAEAAGITLLMVTGGEALEEMALDRAGYALQTLLETNPGMARLVDGTDVPALSVKVGDVFVVRPNETVAVDAVLLFSHREEDDDRGGGVVLVDEKIITGEPVSTRKAPGDVLYAGSVNRSSMSVRARALKVYQDSVFRQMQSTLESALERKSRVELNSKRIADNLTPVTVLAACVGFLVTTRVRRRSVMDGWRTVLSVLMSATPCPADIGVPVAMLSGMSRASEKLNATIKSGDALEGLCDCRCVVFDKTGTLTFGRPAVSRVVVVWRGEPGRGHEDNELFSLGLLAAVEAQSKHVLADAIHAYFQARQLREQRCSVTQFQETPGLGATGLVKCEEDGPRASSSWSVRVGSAEFFPLRDQLLVPSARADVSESGVLRTFFTISVAAAAAAAAGGVEDAYFTGYVEFNDPIREESFQLVRTLREQGVYVVILSGDRSAHLENVARQLTVDAWHSCLPHEKALKVKELQARFKEGTVVMVGDGANDSAALAQAHVGISIDPSSLSSEAAEVVILNGDVARVGDLIALGKRVVRIARSTVRVGTSLSLVQVALAVAGVTSPFQNSVMQEIVDLGSVLSAMRAMWM